MKFFFPTTLLAILFSITINAEPIRILTIGNSFSEAMTHWLPLVAKSAGIEIEVEDLTIGGCTMERHWSNITKETNEPGYHYFEHGTYQAKLASKQWDFVTIQQASAKSWNSSHVVSCSSIQNGLTVTSTAGDSSASPFSLPIVKVPPLIGIILKV